MAVTLGGLFNRNLLTKAVVYEKTDGRFSQSIEIGGCETYELCLTWSRGQFPEVWARAGALERCEDLDSIPHQFGFDEKSKSVKLCLQRQDWDSGQLIADTYVPWAMEWLVFFELWLATGEWLGGGEHAS